MTPITGRCKHENIVRQRFAKTPLFEARFVQGSTLRELTSSSGPLKSFRGKTEKKGFLMGSHDLLISSNLITNS